MSTPRPQSFLARLWRAGELAIRAVEWLQPAALLAARWFVAGVFFRSGLTKIADWDTTLLLFTEEYRVPLLSPSVAAAFAAGGELVLPVLLVLGLGGRVAAAGLFVVNAVAVISVPEMADAARALHVFWGSLLLGLWLWGPGAWSVDHWLWPWLKRRVVGTL